MFPDRARVTSTIPSTPMSSVMTATPSDRPVDAAGRVSAGASTSNDAWSTVMAQRVLSAAAAIVVLARLTAAFPVTADGWPGLALLLALVSVVLVVIVVLSAVSSSRVVRHRMEIALLVAGAVVVLVEQRAVIFVAHHMYPSDEGRLGQYAIDAISHGHDPYTRTWPSVARFAGNTPLFGGGGVVRFGYPPLSAEVGAALGALWRPLGTPGVVDGLGLLAAAVVVFTALPRGWRATAVIVALGLAPLTTYAVNGHPAMLALPLLCAACLRWTQIGAGGHLGLTGIAQAVCLGLAAAAQQLAWFVAIGVVLAIWLIRRGELPADRARTVVARYLGIAGIGWVLVNLPFAVVGPGAWLRGVLSVLTQHAVASGQGVVMLSVVLRGQGGRFQLYSYAGGLTLLAIIGATAIGIRRLAPAVPVLFALVFVVTARSQGEYLLVLAPVWLVWLVGSDPAAIARSRPLGRSGRWSMLHTSRRKQVSVAVVAMLPAAACVAVAVSTPGPLALRVVSSRLSGPRITAIEISAVNRTDHAVVAHYYVDARSHIRSPWRIVSGPARIKPGERVSLTLQPGFLGPPPATHGLRVWALSDGPAALSSAALSPAPLSHALHSSRTAVPAWQSNSISPSGEGIPTAAGSMSPSMKTAALPPAVMSYPLRERRQRRST